MCFDPGGANPRCSRLDRVARWRSGSLPYLTTPSVVMIDDGTYAHRNKQQERSLTHAREPQKNASRCHGVVDRPRLWHSFRFWCRGASGFNQGPTRSDARVASKAYSQVLLVLGCGCLKWRTFFLLIAPKRSVYCRHKSGRRSLFVVRQRHSGEAIRPPFLLLLME
jgi:hypothetical protein